jgi:hypothetical protein
MLGLICFEIVLIFTQVRRTVCTKCNIGSKVILEYRMVHLGDEAQVKARFDPFGDSANLNAR